LNVSQRRTAAAPIAAKKKREAKEEVKQIVSDLKSVRSVNRNIDKHCHEGECGGKKIAGQNWARHCLEIHADIAPNAV
jgi:hypothetical protein